MSILTDTDETGGFNMRHFIKKEVAFITAQILIGNNKCVINSLMEGKI